MMTYRVSITTGPEVDAGTTSDVYLIIYGDKASTNRIELTGAPIRPGEIERKKFQPGNTDNFLVEIPNIGSLKSIRLVSLDTTDKLNSVEWSSRCKYCLIMTFKLILLIVPSRLAFLSVRLETIILFCIWPVLPTLLKMYSFIILPSTYC